LERFEDAIALSTSLNNHMDEQDISLEDLEKSEQMLKDSLFKISHIAGLINDQLEADWQLLKREAELKDLHIDEL
jgi:2-polyprenyl-6-methoxyphenol hydroxylase-like FAD-dependent oxidoreductase